MPHAMLRSLATPKMSARLFSKSWVMRLLEHVEGTLEVLARVDAEGHERIGANDAGHTAQMLGHYTGDLIPFGDTQDGNEIPVTGDGVNLGNAIDLGDLASSSRNVIAF